MRSVMCSTSAGHIRPARMCGVVEMPESFEPGAQTARNTHPLGQTLIVTAGVGRLQHLAGPIEETRPGDIVWFPPGTKHWRATGDSPLPGQRLP